MEKTFVKLFQDYPELFYITKESNNLVAFGERIFKNDNFLCSLMWVYKFYFNKEITLFLPKTVDINIDEFNNYIGCDIQLADINIFNGDIESFDNTSKSSGLVIYAYADIIFNDHVNKKRLVTQIKNTIKRNKVIVLSCTSLKQMEIGISSFSYFSFEKPEIHLQNLIKNTSCIDLYDDDEEIFDSNIQSLIDIIEANKSKRIYISLDLPIPKIKEIEILIKGRDINIYRKENGLPGVVINASKTTQKTFLKWEYDIYIFKTPVLEKYGVLSFIKDLFGKPREIYIDTTCMSNIVDCCSFITNEKIKRNSPKDSIEYKTYKEINIEDPILISEKYYLFQPTNALKQLDLNNLSKNDYDTIRHFVKVKLNIFTDIRSCQLTTPSSPKDRSRKLNSFANKISSKSYRCDVTCEIFKDYTIGVVVWNQINYPVEPGNYVYQTTNGNWKYTTLS